jgi:hypothetical protein
MVKGVSCRAALPERWETMNIVTLIASLIQALTAMVELSINLFDRWKRRKKEDKPP